MEVLVNMRTTIKKVIALTAGATMVGSTIVGAMAADLASWPAPFVTKGADGKPSFDAMLVVGDLPADPADIIGITDIAVSLQFQMTENVAVTGSTDIGLQGDSKKVESGSNKLEWNETVSSITTSVTSSDLSLLADGEFSNEYASSTLQQTITIPSNGRMVFDVDPDDDTSAVKPYFKLSNGGVVYTFTLSFSPSVKTDHNTGGNGYLEDIRNKKLSFLGQTYTILVADHTAQNNTILTLMGGAVTDVIDEGETRSYTIGGEPYEVTASFISATEAKLKVNGELTDSLTETKTYKLKDGTEVGIIDILGQNLAGEVDRVEFSLGANKLQLTDENTVDHGFGGTVTIGSEELSNVKVNIETSQDQGITSGNDVKLSAIKFNYNASQDIYVPVGSSASTKADEAESQVGSFLLSAFDYKFEGPQVGSTEEVKFLPSGSNNYKLEFKNKAGVKYSESVVGYDGTSVYKLGRYSGSTWYDLVSSEREAIDDEDYFCVNKNKYSRILQYKDVVPGASGSDNEGTLKLRDVGSGDTYSISYSGSSLGGDLILDGNTYSVNASTDANGAKIWVDLNGNGARIDNLTRCEFWTQFEANVSLQDETFTRIVATNPHLTIVSEDDEDNSKDVVYVAVEANSDGKIDLVNNIDWATSGTATLNGNGGNSSMNQKQDESNVYQSWTNYGMFLEMDRKGTGTDTQNDFVVKYPDNQVFGAFFVVGGATTTSVSGGSSTNQVIHRINVGATKLASAVSDVSAQNLIVVGGPCANAVAAELMGNPEPCGKDFSAGRAMIKLYEASTGKVAMLVAGYEAVDTTRATKVVAQNGGADLKALAVGVKEVEVNTVNEQPSVVLTTS